MSESQTDKPRAAAEGQPTDAVTTLRVGAVRSTKAADGDQLPDPFGQYRIARTLGRGGMATVYLAEDTQLKRNVALKVPRFDDSDPGRFRERFLREARAAACLNHPNICRIYAVGEESGIPYMTMDFVDGRPLNDIISADKAGDARHVVLMVRKLALALKEAHQQGVVHRDLKPSNVMINGQGEPVLMDFGLARRIDASDPTFTLNGALVGTPAYMSPEQAAGDVKAIGPASDIYSLGVILYELLTGQRPFTGKGLNLLAQINTEPAAAPSSLRPEVDRRLDFICETAMAKRPDDRYKSMAEFAESLTAFLKSAGNRPTAARTAACSAPNPFIGFGKQESPPRSPNRLRTVLALAGMVVVIAIVATVASRSQRPRDSEASAVPTQGVPAAGEAGAVVAVKIPEPTTSDQENRDETEPSVSKENERELPPRVVVRRPEPTPESENGEAYNAKAFKPLVPKKAMTEKIELAVDPSRSLAKATLPAVPQKVAPAKDELPLAKAPFTEAKAKVHQRRWGDKLRVSIVETNSIGMKLVLIPPGEFAMGSAETPGELLVLFPSAKREIYDAEQPVHQIRLTRPLVVGMYEVTQEEYQKVMGAIPSHFSKSGEGRASVRDVETRKFPVERVSADDAREFCRRLSLLEAEEKAGRVYRLPTEAEWEFACRAGTTTPFSFGESCNGREANSNGSQPFATKKLGPNHGRPTVVGSYAPNAFGLFDMHGNVAEWCADEFDPEFYSHSPAADPINRGTGMRSLRGGGWNNQAVFCRSAARAGRAPTERNRYQGFRVASDPPPR